MLVCLVSEWRLNIMNEKHPESCVWWGTNNGSTTEWRWRFTTADSHNGGREGLPWERVFPSTARIITTDPESSARKYMAIPETPKERSAFVWGYHAESYQLCLLSSGHSWIPPSWFSVIAPAPHCAQELDMSFFQLLSCLKFEGNLSPLLGSCSLIRAVFPIFSWLSLFLKWHLSVLRTSDVLGSTGQLVILS